MWGQSMKKPSASSLTQVVVIPAYEPPDRFPETVRFLLAENRSVVVVDDGSGERYAPIFSELSALPGCTVLIREKNHGKGAALRMAFRYLANAFSDITVITADCDGRYRPQDILRLAEVSARHPDALCLGVLGEKRSVAMPIRELCDFLSFSYSRRDSSSRYTDRPSRVSVFTSPAPHGSSR